MFKYLILSVVLLSVPSLGFGYPSIEELQAQVGQLQSQIQQLQRDQRSTEHERDRAQTLLDESQTLLGQRPFSPQILQAWGSSDRRSLSPLPNKRLKVKYLASRSGKAQRLNLNKIMQKGPVLIALWATWCKPCVSPQEQAHLRELQQKLDPYGVPLLSMGIDDWAKINKERDRWFYPLWHVKDAHLNLSPERLMREVGLGLPLFFLRLPDGRVPFYLAETLSTQSVQEWLTVAVREKLKYTPFSSQK